MSRRLRQAHRRVFVYLPLVGENEDDDRNNERAHAGEPHERLCRNACERGRHRLLTLPGPRRPVKSKGAKTDKAIDAVRSTGQSGGRDAHTERIEVEVDYRVRRAFYAPLAGSRHPTPTSEKEAVG